MKNPSETAIVNTIVRYLRSLPGCAVRKRWGGGMGVAGDPDITGCIRGRHLELEVKRPGGKPTPLQEKRLREWRDAGAVVEVVASVEDVREILRSQRLL